MTAFKRRTAILSIVFTHAAVGMMVAVVSESKNVAMAMAIVAAVSATALTLDRRPVERLGGTAMVVLVSFALVFVGTTRFLLGDGGEAAYLEVAIGTYLGVAGVALLRRG